MITKIKHLIIGGGISGVIASEILGDSLIIERASFLGGEMTNNILGPKMYHDTPSTRNFFRKYVMSTSTIRSTTILDGKECTDKKAYDKKIGYSFKNSQNSSLKQFSSLNLDLEPLYENQNALLSSNVIKIDISKKLVYVLCNKAICIIQYDYLISTIDYELFLRLCDLKNDIELKKRGVLYYNFKGDYKQEFQHLNDYNFWYNLTNDEFFRCTNLSKKEHTLELFTENSINIVEQVSKYFDSITDALVYYNPSAKIWTKTANFIKYNKFNEANIYLLGRNALYNHDRIQDSIDTAYMISKEIKGETL